MNPSEKGQLIGKIGFGAGLVLDQVIVGPGQVPQSAQMSKNVWFNNTGRVELWRGSALRSGNVGARIIAVNTERGSIKGASINSSISKYQYLSYLFLSDQISADVFLDETARFTTASTANKLRVAVPNGSGGYNQYDAGLTVPTAPTLTAVAGGTKGLQGDVYIRVRKKRIGTGAVGNPSESVKATLAANQRPQITFAAADTSEGQDSWVVEVVSGGSWYVYHFDGAYEITEADVAAAGRNVAIDWTYNELGRVLTTDFDPPPLATCLIVLADIAILCGTGGSNGGAPGPVIAFSKSGNPEAFSPFYRAMTSGGEDVIWAYYAEGRIYILCANGLQVLNFTGQTAQSFQARAIWSGGFANAHNGVIINNQFYGFSGNGPVRSRTQDDADQSFAEQVLSYMEDWNRDYVVLGGDPKKAVVVYFHWVPSKGYTEALAFHLAGRERWSGIFYLPYRVTSAATVNGRLELSVLNGSNYNVLKWNEGSGAVDGYVVSIWDDAGNNGDKTISGWEVTGKAQLARIFLPTKTTTGDIYPDVTDPANAEILTQTLSGSLATNPFQPANFPFQKAYAMRVDFNAAGQRADVIHVYGSGGSVNR